MYPILTQKTVRHRPSNLTQQFNRTRPNRPKFFTGALSIIHMYDHIIFYNFRLIDYHQSSPILRCLMSGVRAFVWDMPSIDWLSSYYCNYHVAECYLCRVRFWNVWVSDWKPVGVNCPLFFVGTFKTGDDVRHLVSTDGSSSQTVARQQQSVADQRHKLINHTDQQTHCFND